MKIQLMGSRATFSKLLNPSIENPTDATKEDRQTLLKYGASLIRWPDTEIELLWLENFSQRTKYQLDEL